MSNNSEIYFKRRENTQGKYCNCMHVLIILFMLCVILYVSLMLFYSKFQICVVIYFHNYSDGTSRNGGNCKRTTDLKLPAKTSCKAMFQKSSLDIDIEWTLLFCGYIISVFIHLANADMWFSKLINIFEF